MKFKVNKENIEIIETDVVNKGEYNLTECEFEFSEEYTNELVKVAIFTNSVGSYRMLIDANNKCDIPYEITNVEEHYLLGVYAYKLLEDGETLDLRYSPKGVYLEVIEGSFRDADGSETPTDIIAQLANRINEVANDLASLSDVVDTKVDKIDGYSLISNTEIERLANVDNYDDTEVKGDISDLETLTSNQGTEINNIKSTYSLITETGSQIALTIDSTDYKMTAILKDKNGNTIYTSNVIDLPLESVVVNGSYDDNTKKVILTLQNGSTIEFSIADLVNGLVSETQLNTILESYYTKSEINNLLNNKVDKITGKGLSTNDYTNEEKAKLAGLSNYDDTEIRGDISDLKDSQDIQDTKISELEEENDYLNEVISQLSNLKNTTPLVASSISGMVDTTRIYVNSTDGHWYWYDGSAWVDGGVYQATQISDNSISLLLLDEDLQENFNYTAENLSLTDYATNKFMNKNGNLIELNNATCKKYDLEINKSYIFTGYDDSLLCSLVIKNENDEVIFVSNPSNQVKKYARIFLVRENNLTAYISTENLANTILLKYTSGVLAEISNISTKNNELSLVYDIDNNFLVSSSINHTNLEIIQENSYRTLIYRMVKGQKYNIKSYDYSLVCGLLIIDFDYNKLYYSSNEDLHDTRREVNYTFTANKNGFIIISYNKNYYPGNIIIESNENSNIYGKRISFLGDSICQGVGDAIGGYGKIIADNNNMIYQNKGVGGGTITSGTYYNNNTPRFWINEHINDLNIFSDYIILEGGVNDSSLGVPLGELSENYNSTLDINTFYGAFENMLKQLITRFKGKKYGYIFVHQMTANYKITNNPDSSYYYAAKKCCEKWGVPYLDLNDKVPPLGLFYSQTASQELIDLKTLYTNNGDGWHPNLLGYNKYYVPKIESWLNNL